jgi:outer membrane protein OmpA-like peptidoglycan-associated protein
MYNQSMELMYKEGPQSQSGDAAMKIAADAREADCNWTKPKLGEGINEEAEEEINEASDEKDDKEAKKEVNEQVEDEINEEVEEELNESFVTDRNTLRRKQREDLNKRLTKLWSK